MFPKKKQMIILFWVAIMVLIWFGDEKEMPFIERITGLFLFAASSIAISFSFSKTLFTTTVAKRKTLPFILKFLSMAVCLDIVYALLYKFLTFLERKEIFSSFRFISEDSKLITTIIEDLPGLIAVTLLFCGILLYYEYSELRTTNLKYHLQILHSQISPHFMFNVLNHIYVLMDKDVNMASTLLLKYSETLRYQLYNGKEDFARLDQEIAFLNNYIDVEKFRWEDKLDITCLWEIEDGGKKIAPLVLVVFIENAFKHVSRSSSQKGYIQIALRQEGDLIHFEVENSKSNINKKKKSIGIGLENVKARLDILYPQQHKLLVEETNTTYYTHLTIKL